MKLLVALCFLLVLASAQVIRLEEGSGICGQAASGTVSGLWVEAEEDTVCMGTACEGSTCGGSLNGCYNTGPLCDDGIACSEDSCDPMSGACTSNFLDVTCNATPDVQPPITVHARKGDSLFINLGLNDADGDALTVTIMNSSAGGPIVSGTEIEISDVQSANGIWYRVDDGNSFAVGWVGINLVDSTNQPPSFGDSNVTLYPGTNTIFSAPVSDVDGDAINISTTYAGSNTVSTTDPNQVDITIINNTSGNDPVPVEFSDGANTSSGVIDVRVANEPPLTGADAVTTNEINPIVGFSLAVSDPNGDSLTFTITSTLQHGTGSIVNGLLDYTPIVDGTARTENIVYQASDGQFTTTGTVDITIITNAQPVGGTDFTDTVDFGTTATFTTTITDAEGDPITVTETSPPSAGTATINFGTMTGALTIDYDAAAGNYGEITFEYTVSDGISGDQVYTVTVTVNNVFDTPGADTFVMPCNCATGKTDTHMTLQGGTADVDGVSATVQLLTGPGGSTAQFPTSTVWGGSLSLAGSNVVYTHATTIPDPVSNQPDLFYYRVIDQGTPIAFGEVEVTTTIDSCSVAGASGSVVNDPGSVTYQVPTATGTNPIFATTIFPGSFFFRGQAILDITDDGAGQALWGSHVTGLNPALVLDGTTRTPQLNGAPETFAVHYWLATGVSTTNVALTPDVPAGITLPTEKAFEFTVDDGGSIFTVVVEHQNTGSLCFFFPSATYPASMVSIGATDFNGNFFPIDDSAGSVMNGGNAASITQGHTWCLSCVPGP